MEDQSILMERRAGYRVITLNRPQRLNAFTEAMHRELLPALATHGGVRGPGPRPTAHRAGAAGPGLPGAGARRCSSARHASLLCIEITLQGVSSSLSSPEKRVTLEHA